MAFDDLTPSQRDALIPLIEALLTEKYNEEFFLTRQAGRRQGDIHLTYKHTKSGGQGLPGFTDSETQAFKEAGYLSTSTNFSAALKIKAYREYKDYKDSLNPLPPSEQPKNHERIGDAVDGRAETSMTSMAQDTRNVFVVHGRNLDARNSLFRFLRSIGLRPLEWSQAIKETGKASPFIGEILDVAFSKAQAVVVLFTPDDEARLRERFRGANEPAYETELTGQARPNVLFEAGMAMGRNPDRTVLVELGTLRPFSDIAGRHAVRLSNDSAARQELAQRLETAGCAVDLTGRDWHTEGDFKSYEELISPLKVAAEFERGAEAATATGVIPPKERVAKDTAVPHRARFTVLDAPAYGFDLKTGSISLSHDQNNGVALVEFYRETDDTALPWIEVRAHVEFYAEGKRIARLNDGFWYKEHEDLTKLAKFKVGDTMYLAVAINSNGLVRVFDGHLAKHRVGTRYVREFLPKFDKVLPHEALVQVKLLSVQGGQTVLDEDYNFGLTVNPFSLTVGRW